MNLIGIEAENIACDGWAIGYDERFPKSKRIQQALMFARFGKHENLYAHPLVSRLISVNPSRDSVLLDIMPLLSSLKNYGFRLLNNISHLFRTLFQYSTPTRWKLFT